MDPISVEAALLVAGTALLLALPLPAAAKKVLLLAANVLFLASFHWLAPVLFLVTSLLGYGGIRLAVRGAGAAALALACAPLLVPLFLPKLEFAADWFGGDAAVGNVGGARLAFFIGASYYTLRALHCVLDARRTGQAHFGLFDFLVYNSFFPTIVAGPIERADHFAKTFERLGRPSADDLREAAARIFTGLLKKVVVAGILWQWAAPITSFAAAASAPDFATAWRALYAIALYAYFDFAGYSDLAIGAARLFGIRLAENFDNPYLRPSIAEFWRGWHLSLSFWIRDYLFLPLAGRTASVLRPHLAALGSMTLCGLWHDPSIGWTLWGLAHGAGLSVHQAWTLWLRKRFKLKKKLAQSLPFRVFATLLTFHFVALTWVLVSIDANRLGPALDYVRILLGLG